MLKVWIVEYPASAKEAEASYILAELKYVKVITATTSDGVDKDEAVDGMMSEAVAVLVTPEQAERFAYYNATTSVHFTLVYKGEAEKADAFIQLIFSCSAGKTRY